MTSKRASLLWRHWWWQHWRAHPMTSPTSRLSRRWQPATNDPLTSLVGLSNGVIDGSTLKLCPPSFFALWQSSSSFVREEITLLNFSYFDFIECRRLVSLKTNNANYLTKTTTTKANVRETWLTPTIRSCFDWKARCDCFVEMLHNVEIWARRWTDGSEGKPYFRLFSLNAPLCPSQRSFQCYNMTSERLNTYLLSKRGFLPYDCVDRVNFPWTSNLMNRWNYS